MVLLELKDTHSLDKKEHMSDLIVTNIDGQLLVDSRLIAERLGIQHETVVKHLKKYATQFQAMGNLRFEIGASAPNSNGARHQVSFALLNEPQSTFLMTLSKNTDLVVQCKLDLVIAFEKAKQLIATVIPAQSDRIKELELELAIRQLDSHEKMLSWRQFRQGGELENRVDTIGSAAKTGMPAD